MLYPKKLIHQYPSQLALLLAVTGGCFIVSGLVLALLGNLIFHVPLTSLPAIMMQTEHANWARLINTIVAAISFGLPSVILAFIVTSTPFQYLGFNSKMSIPQLGVVAIITIASILLAGALAELNQQIPLPKDWAISARAMEAEYQKSVLAMAYMPNFGNFLFALLTIAAAPAIFEELLFRAGLQNIFIGLTRSPFWGILIAAILFSAIHFSYYGFIPRIALGALLGLVYYYGKNIWLNIFFHFLNNAIIVVQLYVAGLYGKSMEKTMDEKMPVWWGIVAGVLLVLLFQQFRKLSSPYWSSPPSLFTLNQPHESAPLD
ncbi:MAG: CPBP family intramembrane metalloprotease [Sediminibacterium sp.]|nr:CPBP family intramembrane metalloprotease [Sediminibacterium sp.]